MKQASKEENRKQEVRLWAFAVNHLHTIWDLLVRARGWVSLALFQWRGQYRGKGGQSATPDSEKFAKNWEKSGKNRGKRGKIRKNQEKIGKKRGKIGKNQEKIGKKEEKSGRKGKKREDSFTLPLLTERAGYATALFLNCLPCISPLHGGCNPILVRLYLARDCANFRLCCSLRADKRSTSHTSTALAYENNKYQELFSKPFFELFQAGGSHWK